MIKQLTSALVLCSVLTGAAVAAPVNRTYNFQTGHFTGSFSLQFDNANDVVDTGTGLSLLSLTTDLTGWDGAYEPVFRYVAASDLVLFGFWGSGLINAARDDLLLAFRGTSTDTPTFVGASYQWFSQGQTGRNDTRIGLSSSVNAQLPEPGTVALTLAALAGGGFVRRLRRR